MLRMHKTSKVTTQVTINTEYGGFYTGVESTVTFTGDFQRTRVALGAFHRASNVGDGNYLRNSATGYTRTKASTIISVRERASTNIELCQRWWPERRHPLYYIGAGFYTGNYTGTANFTGNFLRLFVGNYVRTFNRVSTRQFSSVTIDTRNVTFTGNYLGNYARAYAGT